MSIICKVDYDTAKQYKGCNLKTKYNNRTHQVGLKLICDDSTLKDSIELARGNNNILMVEYKGLDTNEDYINLTKKDTDGVYIAKVLDILTVDEDIINNVISDLPEGITPVIRLPEDYCNIEFLVNITKKYPNIRFANGILFSISGVNVGSVGIDILSKNNFKYNANNFYLQNTDDVIEDVNIANLELVISTNKVRTKKSTQTTQTTKQKAKPKVKQGKSMSMAALGAGSSDWF